MRDSESGGALERWEREVFLGTSVLVGLVTGWLLSPFVPPFGLAIGLFGGSVTTFFVLSYLLAGE